jgi:anti-sigma factor RsiW
MSVEDAELVGLIDNELDEDAKRRVLVRLAEDDALCKRYEALREVGPSIDAAFDALLEKAPLSRLRAAIPSEIVPRIAYRPFASSTLRGLAAGFVIGLLAAGAAAWMALSSAPHGEREDWRAAVVEYMELYTNKTFAFDDVDPLIQAKKLNAFGRDVGMTLTPEDLALPGLRFKTAQILAYDGAPLVEFAYVDGQGAPVLFCIIANGEADASTHGERRGDYSLTSWSRAGRSYLVIGRLSGQHVAEFARALEKRIAKI